MFIWWIPWLLLVLITPRNVYSVRNYTTIPMDALPFIIFPEKRNSAVNGAPVDISTIFGKNSAIFKRSSNNFDRTSYGSDKVLEGMGGSAVQTLSDNNLQKFAAEPTPQMAVLGSTAVLPCRVRSKVGHLQWTKDGFGLGTERGLSGYGRYSMIGSDDEGDFSLKIHPVLLVDDALYQCQVSAGSDVPGIRSRPVKLTVYAPPDPPVLRPIVVKTTAGMSVEIVCESKGGRPPPEVQWIDDSKREPIRLHIQESRNKMADKKRFIVHSRLNFTPQRSHNNKTITCSTSNQALSSPLTVSALLEVYYPPDVVLKSKPEHFTEGDNIIFTCNAEANPSRINYRWFRNSVELANETSRILKLTNVLRDFHHGTISCEVSNKVGASKKTQTLYIQYGPRFKVYPKDVMAELETEVDLKCDVESNPIANIVWLRGSSHKIIGSGPTFRLKATTETAGLYRCIARVRSQEAEFADLEGRIRVLIKGPPKIISLSEQQGKRGMKVELECKTVSVPRPIKVTWTYRGHNIDSDDPHYKIVTDVGNERIRNVLIILKAEKSDFGEYNCSVVNEYGVARKLIHLKEKQKVPVYLVIGCVVVASLIFVFISFIVFRSRRKPIPEAIGDTSKELKETKNGGVAIANMYSAHSDTKLDAEDTTCMSTLQRPFLEPKISPAPSPRFSLQPKDNGVAPSNMSYTTPFVEEDRSNHNRRASMSDVSIYPQPGVAQPSNPPEFCTIRRTSRTQDPLISSPVMSNYRNGNINHLGYSSNGAMVSPQMQNPLSSGRIEYAYRPPTSHTPPPPPPYPRSGYKNMPMGNSSPKNYSRPIYEARGETSRIDPETQYIFSPEAMLKPGTLV